MVASLDVQHGLEGARASARASAVGLPVSRAQAQ